MHHGVGNALAKKGGRLMQLDNLSTAGWIALIVVVGSYGYLLIKIIKGRVKSMAENALEQCPECKTVPQHGSCVCDEQYVIDLKAQNRTLRDEIDGVLHSSQSKLEELEAQVEFQKKVIDVLAEDQESLGLSKNEAIEWAEAKAGGELLTLAAIHNAPPNTTQQFKAGGE